MTTLDVDPSLVEQAARLTADAGNVVAIHADGLAATALMAEHDRAWITFAVCEPPHALIDALREGAALLVPIGPPDKMQTLVRFTRQHGAVVAKEMAPAFFIPVRALVMPDG